MPIGPGSIDVQREHRVERRGGQVRHADAQGQGAQHRVAEEVAEALGDVGADPRGGPLRSGRKLPTRVSSARAARRSARRCHPAPGGAAATTSPPSGGPMNWLAVSSTAYRWLLALASRSLSVTMLGTIDWAAVSNSVSPTPRAKPTVEHPQLLVLGRDDDGEQADQHGASQVDERHRAAPVEPVGEGPGDEGEHQPRQPAHQGHRCEGAGVAGDAPGRRAGATRTRRRRGWRGRRR